MSILNSNTPTANFGDYGDSVYRTKQYMYPIDLLSVDPNKNEYGGQYMLIYINVISDTSFKRADEQLSAIPNISKRVGKELSGLKAVGSKFLQGNKIASAIALAGGLSGGAGGILSAGAGGGLLGAAIGTALGGALGVSLSGEFSKPRKRLLSAIALHIPNNISIQYGVNYGEADGNIADLAMRGLDASADSLKALINTPAGAGKEALKQVKDNSLIPGLQGAGLNVLGDTGKIIGKLASVATNPKKEQIFEGVPFRSFSYTYDFYPRSEEESENVKRILDELKYHMHPNFKDDAGFLFEYPAEFDIFFMHKGQENKFIHKHRSAVLESLAVNYSPNGQFSAFANGSPTAYQATMNFKEVSIITKEALENMGEVKQRGTTSATRNFGGQSDTF
jgi:hypothetical protein